MTRSSPPTRRRLVLLGALGLTGCGFALRKAPHFAFSTIAVPGSSALVNLLRRNLKATGTLTLVPPEQAMTAEAILDILSENRDRVVVATDSAGLVRELQLGLRVRLRLRTPAGKELIGPTEIALQRDISYSETNALAKEGEEQLLYRDMQNDVVQQILRRVAAVKSL